MLNTRHLPISYTRQEKKNVLYINENKKRRVIKISSIKKIIVGVRHTVKIAVILIIAIVLILGIIKLTFKQTYSVSLNGEVIGYTQDKVALQKRINDYINKGNGDNIAFVELKEMPEYEACLLKNNIQTNDDEIFSKVTSSGTNYYKYYAITEENEEKAYVKDFSEAESIVNQLKEKKSTNADNLGIVEKYSTEQAEYKTAETCVNELYKEKKVVVAQASIPKASYTGPSVATSLGISLVKPVSGVITSRFGTRSLGNHTGIDIGAPKGTAIKAAASGTVIFSGYGTSTNGYNNYGNVVAIKSNSSVTMLYAHCSALYVKTGEQVSQGQVIGAVGSTGRSTGNHLHFEIKVNGRSVNPQNYIY